MDVGEVGFQVVRFVEGLVAVRVGAVVDVGFFGCCGGAGDFGVVEVVVSGQVGVGGAGRGTDCADWGVGGLDVRL